VASDGLGLGQQGKGGSRKCPREQVPMCLRMTWHLSRSQKAPSQKISRDWANKRGVRSPHRRSIEFVRKKREVA